MTYSPPLMPRKLEDIMREMDPNYDRWDHRLWRWRIRKGMRFHFWLHEFLFPECADDFDDA